MYSTILSDLYLSAQYYSTILSTLCLFYLLYIYSTILSAVYYSTILSSVHINIHYLFIHYGKEKSTQTSPEKKIQKN